MPDSLRTACKRCGRACLGERSSRPGARPFRKAVRGLCADCAVTRFFKDTDEGLGFALPEGFDPSGLLLPHIQRQFLQIMSIGGSELAVQDIDWDRVIEQWELPI